MTLLKSEYGLTPLELSLALSFIEGCILNAIDAAEAEAEAFTGFESSPFKIQGRRVTLKVSLRSNGKYKVKINIP